MKSKSFMLMVLSMGFGLVAAIGISQVMGRAAKNPTVAAPQMGPVLVSTEHLNVNTFLDETNIKVEQWPVEIIPETAATNIEQIADMATRTPLSKGLPIMISQLVHKNEMQTIHIPEGMKVVAIKMSEDDTFAGLLKPGDKVDVIGHFRAKDGSGYFSKTFLKALKVFSVNARMTVQAGSREETSTRGSAIVGVLVTERQAEAIVQVQKTGSLKLVLRGDQYIEGDDATLEELLPFHNKAPKMANNDTQSSSEQAAKSLFSAFGSSKTRSAEATSMIVWNGSEPVKTVFEGGQLPEASYRLPNRPGDADRNPSPGSRESQVSLDGPDESDEFSETDRGLDEDQYQGE